MSSCSLVPRPPRGKAWYTLFAHALDFPNIPGIPYHARSDISALLYVTLVYSRIIFRFRDGMSEF